MQPRTGVALNLSKMKNTEILTAINLPGTKDNKQYAAKLGLITRLIAELKKQFFYKATLGPVVTAADILSSVSAYEQSSMWPGTAQKQRVNHDIYSHDDIINTFPLYQRITIETGDADPLIHGSACSYTFDIPAGNIFTNYVLQLAGLPAQQDTAEPVAPARRYAFRAILPALAVDKLKQATSYVSHDKLRPALTGVLLEFGAGNSFTVTGCDSHRLYTSTITAEPSSMKPHSFIVPLAEVKKLLATKRTDKDEPLEFRVYKQTTEAEVNGVYFESYRPKHRKSVVGPHTEVTNCLCFEIVNTSGGNLHVEGTLINERYPDYRCVMPLDNPYKVEVDRKTLIQHIAGAIPMANKVTKQVNLTFNGCVSVEAFDTDFNRESLTTFPYINYNGDKLKIAFNGMLLTEMLKNMTSKTVVLELSTPIRAAYVQESGSTDRRLLMPKMIGC